MISTIVLDFKTIFSKVIKNCALYLWNYASEDNQRVIRNFLEKNPDATYLDCGCWDGEKTLKVAEYIGTKRIIGIEIVTEAAKKASEKGVKVYNHDLNLKFPLPDESIDVITADQVIEHLIDIDNFVSEICRILKANGYAVICTENLASWHNIFALLLGNQPYSGPTISTEKIIGHHPVAPKPSDIERLMPNHTKVFAYNSLKQIFEEYGFAVMEMEGSGYFPFPYWIGKFFQRLDKKHAMFITIKVKKVRKEHD